MNELNNIFHRLKNRTVIFVKPGGNFGDFLIYQGAEKLALQNNLNIVTKDVDDFLNDDIQNGAAIYIHGGGGYNSWCSGAPFLILEKAISVQGGIVIQGACTVELDSEFLSSKFDNIFNKVKAEEIIFISRELKSHEMMQKILPKFVSLILDKDTALYLDRGDFSDIIGSCPKKYDLRVIRVDNEFDFKGDNHFYSSVIVDPPYFCSSFNHWVRIHAGAKSIISNRTHSAILGAILGIPTSIASSSYHKNKSIWEHNLNGMGVEWLNNDDIDSLLDRERLTLLSIFPNKVKSSWKIKKIWNCNILGAPAE